MITIQSFTFNIFSENTYIIFDETLQTAIIDPGCSTANEQKKLVDFISQKKLTPTHLLNTHCHVDHVLGNFFIKEKYQIPLLIHPQEEATLRAVEVYAPNYGFQAYHPCEPSGFIQEKKSLVIGNTAWDILFLPGHSPGHVGFYNKSEKLLISGDVLFYRSIGRTDLPGGHYETLIRSIHQQIFTLPDDVTVYPGHGSTTTVGEEKISNPFCAIGVID